MDHSVNRLNKKESTEWDRAFEKFCKTGVWEKEMKVYLVEVAMGENKKRLEPIAIKTNFEVAFGLISSGDTALISEMVVDKEYPEGIGVCNHWHFDPNEKDDEGE